jgi:uncharacterized protein YjiK
MFCFHTKHVQVTTIVHFCTENLMRCKQYKMNRLKINTVFLFLLFLVFTSFTFHRVYSVVKIKYSTKIKIKVSEPSDIAIDNNTKEFYIPSDNGILYKCDSLGTIIQQAETQGWDFEGVEIKDNSVFVLDESARKVYKYAKTNLKLENVYSTPYNGGRNEGFESLCYNYTKKCFVLITEKNPITIYEYDEKFQLLNQIKFTETRDISSARWFDGHIYLLSDEDRCILKCDADDYSVKNKYIINVINPEGLTFNKFGIPVVAGDDIQQLYYFNALASY